MYGGVYRNSSKENSIYIDHGWATMGPQQVLKKVAP